MRRRREVPPAPVWRRYLRFWRADVASDVRDELTFHLEERRAELEASGLTPEDARQEALRRAGNLEALEQSCVSIGESIVRRDRRQEWFDALRIDASVAVRQIARDPIISVVSILTLALGIGANTAIFSAVYAVLLRPVPYSGADRLTVITETQREFPTGVGPGQFTEWARRNRAFESLSAQTISRLNVSGTATPERVIAAIATPSVFQALYMPPAIGRYFRAEEATPGLNRVVVLGYSMFVQRFGGDPSVIGRSISLNDQPYTIVGVAPAGYALRANDPQLWVPLALTAHDKTVFDDHWLTVVGKRKPGVSLAAAQRDMERVSREIAELHPTSMVDRSARVIDFRADLTNDYERHLAVLFGAVGVILLLACLNVAGLSLARLNARRKEIAIRTALGAGRSRVARQLLTESMVLAGVSGLAALAVAWVATRLLLRVAPNNVPRLDQAGINATVMAFVLATTLVSGAMLGILPALRGARGDIQQSLRDGGRLSTAVAPRDWLRQWLVIAEIALALMLVMGATLFIRSAWNLARIEPGFDTTGLLSVRLSFGGAAYGAPARLTAAADRILEGIGALPHVRAAAATTSLPLADGGPDVQLHVEGRSFPAGQEPFAFIRVVSPNYFETMGIIPRRGRTFTAHDRAGSPSVAVVSEELARRVWPAGDAIGKRFYCCRHDSARVWREIVGVSSGVRHSLTNAPLAEIYIPYEQAPPESWVWFGGSLTLAIRTDGATGGRPLDVREVVRGVDPTIPVDGLRTFEELRRTSTSANRFALVMFSAFAAIALTLAAIGVYGVLAYLVGQRTQEIAVRIALGATRAHIFAMILRQGALLAVSGIVIGLGLALMAGRALTQMLYGVEPNDSVTYVAVALGLGLVALAACYVPARRAATIEPNTALRG